jgi:hypothetical protein
VTKGSRKPNLKIARYVHEFLFSLYVAFAIVSVVELERDAVLAPFFWLEYSINKSLNIPQTDYVRGYIAFASSATALALCIWLVLRLSAGAAITKGILRSFAGAVALAAPFAFWFYYHQKYGWPFGWAHGGAPFEVVLVLVCAQLYLGGRWRFPVWFIALPLAAHYAYWFWIAGGGSYVTSNFTGPAAPILGFCSAFAWSMYVAYLRSDAD